MKIVILAYVIGGLTRGTMLYQLTTVLIQMYTGISPVTYTLTPTIIAVLSISCLLGSLIGTVLTLKLVKRLGRETSLRLVSILTLVLNIIAAPAVHWGYLFVCKALGGVTTVLMVTMIPEIGAEQLDARIRGIVGSLTNVSLQLSMVLCNIIQYFICLKNAFYYISHVLPSFLSVVMIILSFMMKEKSAKEKTLEEIVPESILQKKYKKSLIVALSLGMSIAATGINPILHYSTIIFEETFSSPKSGTIGALITSGVSFLASIFTLPLIKKYKRKTLFCLGLNIMIACYITFIVTLYVLPMQSSTSKIIILAATAVAIVSYHFSSGALFFIIMGEVFPRNIKTVSINITMGTCVLAILITIFIFPLMSQQSNYIMYLCWVLLVEFLIIVFIPETHNRSLTEIEAMMVLAEYRIDMENKVEQDLKDNRSTCETIQTQAQITDENDRNVVVASDP
ncbi:Sugar_(And other) transporter family protein [Hexamita inflata]|uniref:Sugar_(And other) transporter family protein n=1 Tax=Hexamita inflata TaxID=28002 RepID=A0ABP1K267_9EUKA